MASRSACGFSMFVDDIQSMCQRPQVCSVSLATAVIRAVGRLKESCLQLWSQFKEEEWQNLTPIYNDAYKYHIFSVYKMLLFPKIITLKIEGSLIHRSKLRTQREQNSLYLASIKRLPSITRLSCLQSGGLASYSQEN